MSEISQNQKEKRERTSQIFVKMMIKERVKILPKEIGRNIADIILAKVKIRLEGKCSRHGYVKPGSVGLVDHSSGRIEGSSLNADTIYVVSVVADVCNPMPGQVVPARIVDSNKFGLLAQSSIEFEGRLIPILDVIIARQNFHGCPSDIPIDSVRIGDDVIVEVIGKTFELKDTKISVAGRLLRSSTRVTRLSSSIANNKPHAFHRQGSDDDMPTVEEESDDDDEEESENAEEEDEEEDDVFEDVTREDEEIEPKDVSDEDEDEEGIGLEDDIDEGIELDSGDNDSDRGSDDS